MEVSDQYLTSQIFIFLFRHKKLPSQNETLHHGRKSTKGLQHRHSSKAADSVCHDKVFDIMVIT